MNVPFHMPTPLDYFASLVQSDADFPLLEAAISVAQDEYPDVDVQTVLNDVDQLLERVRRRIPADAADPSASQRASGRVKPRTPENCEWRSTSLIAQRARKDLLATRIRVPPARRATSRRLASNAPRSMMANGGSKSFVAVSSRCASECASQTIIALLSRPR